MIYHFGNIMHNVNRIGIWISDFANMMHNVNRIGVWILEK
jgi:hypothetical protein